MSSAAASPKKTAKKSTVSKSADDSAAAKSTDRPKPVQPCYEDTDVVNFGGFALKPQRVVAICKRDLAKPDESGNTFMAFAKVSGVSSDSAGVEELDIAPCDASSWLQITRQWVTSSKVNNFYRFQLLCVRMVTPPRPPRSQTKKSDSSKAKKRKVSSEDDGEEGEGEEEGDEKDASDDHVDEDDDAADSNDAFANL